MLISVNLQVLSLGNPMKTVLFGPSICATTHGVMDSLLQQMTMFIRLQEH